MRPCEECLENNWGNFKKGDDGFVTAICQNCGKEVSWKAKKQEKSMSWSEITQAILKIESMLRDFEKRLEHLERPKLIDEY